MESIIDKTVNLDECVKCSLCLAYCPVAAVNPKFPGPKNIGPDAQRLRLEGIKFDSSLLSYCSNCKTCEIVCPSGVKITNMILQARGKGINPGNSEDLKEKAVRPTLRHNLRDYILGREEYLGKFAMIWPGFVNSVLKLRIMRSLLEKLIGLSSQAALPSYHRGIVAKNGPLANTIVKGKKQIVYFPGCYATYNDASIGRLAIAILEHNGYEVIVPKFNCCGVPLEANGHFSEANENAVKNLKIMEPFLKADLPIITTCTSCGLALKEEYPRVKAPGAQRIGQQTYDLFEFLWKLHEQGELCENFHPVRASLGYHAPCHLKAQGIGTPSVRILQLIPGISVKNLDSGCCGLSGSYGFKEEKHPYSIQIGKPLFERVRQGKKRQDFEEITTECGVCQVQIEYNSGVKTRHPVWFLMKSYNETLYGNRRE
ncbi:anaerobic glycerol-3-phosphate dehydrogenase subunit C [Desulfitobacterium sp. AusDCA]|uniref:anaerobic glycerol-3-phosphate dehydrogenase subunit C n=1 Tax=Desulfitobacterium sp. AusDCA TaxID=3240383 RepID=UPI003DA6F32B